MLTDFIGRQDFNRIKKHVSESEKVLDYGCGSGTIAHYLKTESKCDVTGCDVKDWRSHKDFPFKKLKENKVPFKANSFNTVIMSFMLHHCAGDQERVFKEALRVSKNKLIVLEDVYSNPLEERVVRFFDVLCNLPTGLQLDMVYRSEKEWEKLFKKHGLRVEAKENITTFPIPVRKTLYVLSKKH